MINKFVLQILAEFVMILTKKNWINQTYIKICNILFIYIKYKNLHEILYLGIK